MVTMVKYPKTRQFRDVVHDIQSNAGYHGVTPPVVTFTGTVKLHGTNAAICFNSKGEWWCQSRERVITPESDNAGFASWAYSHKEYFDAVAARFLKECFIDENEVFQVFGEWCGGNIQAGVGLNTVPKMFVLFNSRWITVSEDANADDSTWLNPGISYIVMTGAKRPDNFYHIGQFPTFEISVDFAAPTLVQNELVRITEEVEKDCPVARKLNPEGTNLVGEGVVWTAQYNFLHDPKLTKILNGLRFKVKGEKHTESKVKTLVPIDPEKVKTVQAFVDMVCTENRMNRAIEKLKEQAITPSIKNTGDVIKYIMQDIIEEEQATMHASAIEPKAINGVVAVRMRNHFMEYLNGQINP